LRPQPNVPLEGVAAEVEPAVPEPERLVHAFLVELERERRAVRDDLQRVDLQLDLARRQVRVHGLRRARDYLSLGPQDELVPHLLSNADRLRRPLRVDDELAQAAFVAEVDEDEAAVVPPPVRPA